MFSKIKAQTEIQQTHESEVKTMRCKKTIYTIMYWSVIEKSYTTVYFGNDTEEKKKTIETLMYLLE